MTNPDDSGASLPQRKLYRATTNQVELRTSHEAPDAMPVMIGHFAVYNEWARIESRREGTFMERFKPGSLARTVRERREKIQVLFHHGMDPQVGVKLLGEPRRIESTPVGVEYEVPLFDTSYNRDLLPGLRSGAYGASFSFDVLNHSIVPRHKVKPSAYNPEGLAERTIEEAMVIEFGPCILAAYDGASAVCRSITDEILDIGVLREAAPILQDEEILGRARAFISRSTHDGAGAQPRKYDRITGYVRDAVWAMEPSALNTVIDILSERAAGYRPSAEEIRSRIGEPMRHETRASDDGSVAVIPITGTIAPRQALLEDTSTSGTSVEQIQADFQAALKDPDVSAILFDIESPGGSVDLVPELASEILSARGSKPIVAQANTFAASAAYWLAAACDEIIVSPSGQVGSIGVYAAHRDESGLQAQRGLKTTLVSAAPYKTEGNRYEPLSDEARGEMQSKVDAYYDMFIGAVADGRGVDKNSVEEKMGGGRMVMAAQAVKQGMADKVATFQQTLAKLEAQAAAAHATAAASAASAAASAIANESLIGAGPIPPKSTPTTDKPWDGPGNTVRLKTGQDNAYYRQAHAWQDDSADLTTKAAYKFIHHEVSGDGTVGAANLNGCSAGIAVLNGGRGGADIPAGDRQGVYDHLAKHLRDGGKTPPPLTAASAPAESHQPAQGGTDSTRRGPGLSTPSHHLGPAPNPEPWSLGT